MLITLHVNLDAAHKSHLVEIILYCLLCPQVCEEYRLHRETYYLALDMYDRFMDSQINIQKEQLQLVGVTCLFIASKIEVFAIVLF